MADCCTEAAYDDHAALAKFARSVAVATYEFENVPVEAALTVAAVTPLAPGAGILEVTQDRLQEKRFVRGRGIAVPDFLPVSSVGELAAGLDRIGRPAVLKSRRLGYDGKGQAVIEAGGDPARAYASIGGVPAIVEAFVPAMALSPPTTSPKTITGAASCGDRWCRQRLAQRPPRRLKASRCG